MNATKQRNSHRDVNSLPMVVEQKINVFDVCDTLLNMAKLNKLAKRIELLDLPREL